MGTEPTTTSREGHTTTMSKKVTATVAGVSLLLGVGIGVSGGGSTDPAATPSEPVTETVTAKPETRTVTKTPQACLDALDSSSMIGAIAGDFANTAAGFPPLIPRAYKAGVLGSDGQAIIDRIYSLNDKLDELNGRLAVVVDDYGRQAGECRG